MEDNSRIAQPKKVIPSIRVPSEGQKFKYNDIKFEVIKSYGLKFNAKTIEEKYDPEIVKKLKGNTMKLRDIKFYIRDINVGDKRHIVKFGVA